MIWWAASRQSEWFYISLTLISVAYENTKTVWVTQEPAGWICGINPPLHGGEKVKLEVVLCVRGTMLSLSNRRWGSSLLGANEHAGEQEELKKNKICSHCSDMTLRNFRFLFLSLAAQQSYWYNSMLFLQSVPAGQCRNMLSRNAERVMGNYIPLNSARSQICLTFSHITCNSNTFSVVFCFISACSRVRALKYVNHVSNLTMNPALSWEVKLGTHSRCSTSWSFGDLYSVILSY